MARRDQPDQRKLELLNQLTDHRKEITEKKQVLVQQIAKSKEQLKDKVNVPKLVGNKVKTSFSSSPTKWFIGSAVGGLFISKFFIGSLGSIFKKPKKKQTRGLLYTLAAMAARPVIKSYLLGKAQNYVAQRFSAPPVIPHQPSYYDEYNSAPRD